MRARHPGPADDRGSVMVMALVVVVVFGMVAASIAGFGAVSFKHTRVVRTQTNLRAAADAGIRATVDQLPRHQTLCADFGAAQIPLPIQPNGATVQVSCTYVSGASLGAAGWTMILTAIGASAANQSFVASGASSNLRTIGGSVYLADPSSYSIGAPVEIKDGDLWYPDATCTGGVPPAVVALAGAITITPKPPRGTICTKSTWQALAASFPRPTKPAVMDPSGRDDLITNCRVFFPGTYTTPPALAASNYFVSGDYYFDLGGPFAIKNAVVVAGRPDPTLGDTPQLDPLDCKNPDNNPTVAAAEAGYGATWILGGSTSVYMDANGALEIFRRSQGPQAVSVMTAEDSTGGYNQSTVTLAAGQTLLATDSGNQKQVVIHGLIYAPRARVAFGNVTNSALGQFLGGLVAAGVDMQSSASATGLAISTGTQPSQTKLVIQSTATAADGTKVVVNAVADYQDTRSVADGSTTGGSTTIISPTANFLPDDCGHFVLGDGIPLGATISCAAGNPAPTSATLSQAATKTASNVMLVIDTARVRVNSWRKV